MKETADLAMDRKPAVALAGTAMAELRKTRAAIVRQSAIVWGEHCTECAFPACYSACSFYTPRADGHCRRFAAGIEDVVSNELSLTRIAFRRWGKLEGKGPVALKTPQARTALHTLDSAAARAMAPLPRGAQDGLRWRWNIAKQNLARRGEAPGEQSVFIVEAVAEAGEAFTLTIVPAEKTTAGLFQAPLAIKPGYNRFVLPVREIAARIDLAQPYLIQIEPVAGAGTAPIVFGVVDFCVLSAQLAQISGLSASGARPKIKCVVWDLDNTVWRGTLVEDGVEGVTLRGDAVALIHALDARGVINSIASKNDAALAFSALEKFGLRDLFVFPQISWGPKSEAIRRIAAAMDVGLDTFAFIDDQPFERGEVSELVPEVEVFADGEIESLLALPRFDVPATAESRARRAMYQTEEQRQSALAASEMDYTAFLRSCAIRLEITQLAPANLTRIYELAQRTNQLNFSGTRYTREQLEALNPEDTFVLRCVDRFGDYGIIGFCVLEEARVASFFMSCRAQRKRVEEAFFGFLAERLAARGQHELRVDFRRTAKNGASVAMLEGLGFTYAAADEGSGVFVRPLATPFADRDVVAASFQPRVAEVA